MIEWKKCPETMPEDGQDCLLYNDQVDKVVGPIMFKADMSGWLDFFATPEAGHVFKPGENGATHWAVWNAP